MMEVNGRVVEAVLFDMDGLMFDTESVYTLTWPWAAKEFGYEVTRDVVEGAIGLNAEDGRRHFERAYGEDFPFYPIRIRRLEIAMDYIRTNGLGVKKGLYRLLDFLKENGLKTAVATSSEHLRTDEYLRISKLMSAFDAVICGEDVSLGKPNPQIFLTAAERIGVDIRHCIVLEDSLNGIKAAYRAGALPFMVPDCKQPDEEITPLLAGLFVDLDEVQTFLREHLV